MTFWNSIKTTLSTPFLKTSEFLSKTHTFAILLSIFYIFGIVSNFKNCENAFVFILLIISNILLFIFKLNYKKVIILFTIFLIGIFRADNAKLNPSVLENLNNANVILKGQITSSKQISNQYKRVKFYLDSEEVNIINKKIKISNSKTLINLDLKNDIENKILIGDYIEVKGKIKTPTTSTNPYQFDYKKYLSNNDCQTILYGETDSFKVIKKPSFNTAGKKEKWFFILQKFEITRNKIIEKHSEHIKSPKLEVLAGIIFGSETINPDETIKEHFKNSGLLHLLAASGLNVALIYGIWWWIANLIRFPYNLSILFGAIFVVLYTFMTGFPPSILRASIMLLFVLLGKIIDRTVNSVSLIFFVAFLMLLFSPKMIFDIGFQLSFIVTSGLIICCPIVIDFFKEHDKKFIEKHKKKNRVLKYLLFLFTPSKIASVIIVPLVAQLCVIPLQIHYFNNLAPLSILANIAVIPFIGILSFIGFISSIFALLPFLNKPLILIFDSIANPLLELLLKISEFFSSFKFSLLSINSFNVFQIYTFWTLILLLTLNVKNKFQNKLNIKIFITILLIFCTTFIQIPNKNFEIIMFDVGNADSFLIKSPNNKYILIDTAKLPYRGISNAQTIINKYFQNKRINNLEALVITHFDSDHAGGTIDILNNMKVKKIFITDNTSKSMLSKEIFQYLKNKKLNYNLAKNNETFYIENDFKITNYTPKTENNSKNKENEESIVTLIQYKDKNFLFMADCGIKGFESLKNQLSNNIEILKIGHHGAKNVINQEMLNKLNPKYALISTGPNKFNHPHFETIELLEKNNIKIISSKDYGYTKISYGKNELFEHFNLLNKKIEGISFNIKPQLPFHKTKFTQTIVQNNL